MTTLVELPSPRAIDWWSPTAYNTLRRCPLALAYDRDERLRSMFRRPSTFSALGEVAHKLTELVWEGVYNEVSAPELKAVLSERWNQLAAEQLHELQSAWHPSVPPPTSEWPFYAKSKSRTLMRLISEATAFRARRPAAVRPPTLIEGWLSDETIRLRGRPDRVQWRDGAYQVVDLKAGPHVEEITDAYLQQLLLYAHLVATETGKMPAEVAVVNSIGTVLSRSISSDDVRQAVSEFTSRAAAFNELVDAPPALAATATPSSIACRRCAYRGVCPAFEQVATSDWEARLLKGSVTAISSERTFSLSISTPHDASGSVVTVLLSQPQPLSIGQCVTCVDVYPASTPVRLEWNSHLLCSASDGTA